MLCLIKADDLVLGSFRSEWEQFFALVAKHGARASTGVIGKPSEVAHARDPSVGDWLKPLLADDRLEFWNHGYSHTHEEFFAPVERQIESIRRTRKFLRQVLGADTEIFGPPFNRYGPALFKACAATGVEILYHGESELVPFCIGAECFVSCEVKDTGNDPDGASFKRSFERIRNGGAPYFVLQVHPWRWSSGPQGGFGQFGRILQYLTGEGVRFVTARELRERHPQRAQPAGPEVAQRIVDQALSWIGSAAQNNPRLRHDFFASRYTRGLEAWSAKIEALGLTEQAVGRPLTAVDMGCGVGQWAAAFALRSPHSSVVAVDPGADFLAVLSHAIAGTPLQSRVSIVEARAEDYVHQDEPADVTINAGVLMYADHERMIKNISGFSKTGSRHYLSYHTDQHYFRKVVDAFEVDGNRLAARRWARVHASINLFNCGLGSPWVREWCLPQERLLDLYRISGFDVVPSQQVWDAEDRTYDGAETFVEHVFEKKTDFPAGVRTFVDAQASLPEAIVRLVACGLPRTALDVIDAEGGYRKRADLKVPFLLASTKARELIPVFEMDLDDPDLDPFAIALYCFQIGHTRRALELLASVPSRESAFLQCVGLRQTRRIAEAYELALAQCEEHPREPLSWCALFFLGSVHPDAVTFDRTVAMWRQAHPHRA
jgi:SAM-dependent methyltransferase